MRTNPRRWRIGFGRPGQRVALSAVLTGLVLLWGSWGWGAQGADDDDDVAVALTVADFAAPAVRAPQWQPHQALPGDWGRASVIPRVRTGSAVGCGRSSGV